MSYACSCDTYSGYGGFFDEVGKALNVLTNVRNVITGQPTVIPPNTTTPTGVSMTGGNAPTVNMCQDSLLGIIPCPPNTTPIYVQQPALQSTGIDTKTLTYIGLGAAALIAFILIIRR